MGTKGETFPMEKEKGPGIFLCYNTLQIGFKQHHIIFRTTKLLKFCSTFHCFGSVFIKEIFFTWNVLSWSNVLSNSKGANNMR